MGRARRIGPVAGGVDRERAISPGGVALRHEGRRAVHVTDRQLPAGRDVGRRVGLGQVRRRRRQNRRVVGAGDLDRHRLRSGAAMPIIDRHIISDGKLLACGQEIERAVGRCIGPADRLARVIQGAERQPPWIGQARRGRVGLLPYC